MATMMIAAETRMTTSTAARTRFLPGAGNIFRKELLEWFRTRRFAVTSTLMTLLLGAVPVVVFLAEGGLKHGRQALSHTTYNEMMNGALLLSLTLGAYLIVALTMGMLTREEDSGTAQWLFTKPISRVGYGLAKWSANSIAVIIAAVLIPSLVYVGLMQALFSNGIQHGSALPVVLALTAFYDVVAIAIMMLLGSLFRSQAPIAGIAIGMNLLPILLGDVLSLKWLGLAPVLMGLTASDLAQDKHVTTWEPVVVAVIVLPISLAIACHRLRGKQLQ